MVNTTSIIFMIITVLFTIFMPIAIAIIFYKKVKFKLGALFSGVIIFTLMQVCIRIPIIQNVLPPMEWYQNMSKNLWIYAIFIGLTAGLFEEIGRYVAFKTVLKKKLEWKNGVAYGIGHGGIESIIIVGFACLNNLYLSLMINNGLFDSTIAPAMPEEFATYIRNTLIELPSYMFIVPSVERLLVLVFQIALSLLVMVGIKKRKDIIYLTIAVLVHMIVNAAAVIMMAKELNIWFVQGLVLIISIASIIFVVKARKEEKNELQQSEIMST